MKKKIIDISGVACGYETPIGPSKKRGEDNERKGIREKSLILSFTKPFLDEVAIAFHSFVKEILSEKTAQVCILRSFKR